jgi:hypothetical protein
MLTRPSRTRGGCSRSTKKSDTQGKRRLTTGASSLGAIAFWSLAEVLAGGALCFKRRPSNRPLEGRFSVRLGFSAG